MSLRAAVLALALFSARAHGAQDPPGAAPPGTNPPSIAPVQGPPAAQKPLPRIVRAIVVEGEQRYSEAQLAGVVGLKLGVPLDLDSINRGLLALWSSFHVRGELRYRELTPATPAAAAEIELLLSVVEMPSDREPRFIGNVEIDTKTLKKWALLEERVELFEYQANRVRQRLLEGYRRDGFFWAEIEIVKRDMDAGGGEALGPMTDLIFDIREGPKVRVKGITLRGNRSMPERAFLWWKDGLTSFADPQLSSPGIFNWWGSPFVQETLDADVLALRNVYRERGWLDAVVEVEELRWNDDRSDVEIRIVIDEGEAYVVDEMKVEFLEWIEDGKGGWTLRPVEPAAGRPRFSAEELLAKCELKAGLRYEEVLRKRDEAKLREFYGAEGHLSHLSLPYDMRWDFLEPELFTHPTEHRTRVTYRIVEAHPLTLREISIAGTHHTRDEVLRRELSVFPGGKADQKEINRGLARIQGSGFFSDQFAPETHREPTYRFVEVPGSKQLIDLEYQVEEGRVVEFNLAGGVDSNEGAFGLITLSLRNFDVADLPSRWNRTITELFRKQAFHGAGQRFDIELSPGTVVSRARVHFLEPDIFGLYLEPISLDLDLRIQERRYRTHREERFDKLVRFSRRFGFDTFVTLGFVHTDLEVTELVSDGVPASLARQERLGEVAMAGISFDARTQALDNFISPHDGWKAGIRNTLYTELLSSDFEYLRSDLQFDGYRSTGAKADGTLHGLHLEFDAGSMPTFGGTDEIPYTERFFTGGSSNLRGFALRGAGDRGTDVLGFPTRFAAGGESYLSGTLEWSYPLYSVIQPGTYRPMESLRGVLFLDWGVLGPEAFEIDLEDTRASAGFGIGLAYPLPIQLNFGFPVRRFSGDERQTFSFSIGLNF